MVMIETILATLGPLEIVFGHFTKENIIYITPQPECEKIPQYQKFKKEGHKLAWVQYGKVYGKVQKGWKPVIEKSSTGKPSIFMDTPIRPSLLMHTEEGGGSLS